LHSIVVPKVNFEKLDIVRVIDFLNIKSKELDPDHVGVQFHLEVPPTHDFKPLQFRREVTLVLTNVPLEEVLGYVCAQTNLGYKLVKGRVVLAPLKGVIILAPHAPDTDTAPAPLK
jgi:hypothetical protein